MLISPGTNPLRTHFVTRLNEWVHIDEVTASATTHCHPESELARNPDIYHERQKRTNQHRLVCSTVFNFALISVLALLCLPAVRIQFAAFYSVGCSFRIFVSLTLFTGRQSACTLMLELQYASEALSGKVTEARMRQPRNSRKYSSKSLLRSATTT